VSKQVLTETINYLDAEQKALIESGAPDGVWSDMSKMIHCGHVQRMIDDLSRLRDSMDHDDEASTDQPEPSMAPMANVIRAPQRGGGKP
jgi:hypothetical protein